MQKPMRIVVNDHGVLTLPAYAILDNMLNVPEWDYRTFEEMCSFFPKDEPSTVRNALTELKDEKYVNDFVHAVDSAKRRIAEPAIEKVKKPQRLQREQKKRDRLKDSESKSKNRLNRQENRLNDKHDKYKQKKKKRRPKNKQTKKSLSEIFKSAWKFVKRLWVSSLEESAIRQALSNMKPMSNYDNLFYAGFSRAKADWIVGMNGSRLFSCRFGGKLNIGRVQTPTLASPERRTL